MIADRQTHRQTYRKTDMFITVVRHPTVGGVIS